ncbi:hypothetical protein ACOSQ2_003840 [Xanthoceras sorbifolium]
MRRSRSAREAKPKTLAAKPPSNPKNQKKAGPIQGRSDEELTEEAGCPWEDCFYTLFLQRKTRGEDTYFKT